MERIDRRAVLRQVAGITLGLALSRAETFSPSAAFAQTSPRDDQSPTPSQRLLDEFIEASNNMGGTDNLGYRTTKPFLMDKLWHVGYQSVILQKHTDGIRPLNTLDWLHTKNIDGDLASGKLGVRVPPHFDFPDRKTEEIGYQKRLEYFSFPNQIGEWVEDLKRVGLDLGMPTSFPGDYGAFRVFRFQRSALQLWKDTKKIEPTLVGQAALNAKLLPQESIHPAPVNDALLQPLAVAIPSSSLSTVDAILSWAASQAGISEEYARKIVQCESSFNPKAANPSSGARGLWQIMPIHAERFTKRGWDYYNDWSDPYKNTVIALEVMKEQGLEAWDCR